MSRTRLSSRLGLAAALIALAAGANTASAVTSPAGHAPTFPIPASARVHGMGAPATTTPATPTPGAAAAAGATPTTTPTGAPATGIPATGAPTGAPSTATPGTAGTAPATTVPVSPTRPTAGSRAATVQHAKAGSKRLSTGAVVAAVLAALLILICLAWGAARWFAYEPRWMVSLRHSLAEAGWRLSASWDEFSDWARIGR